MMRVQLFFLVGSSTCEGRRGSDHESQSLTPMPSPMGRVSVCDSKRVDRGRRLHRQEEVESGGSGVRKKWSREEVESG